MARMVVRACRSRTDAQLLNCMQHSRVMQKLYWPGVRSTVTGRPRATEEGGYMESEETGVLYESVAHDISTLISSGTLNPGDRVPSVRHLSRQKRVSISTVLQAYRLVWDTR